LEIRKNHFMRFKNLFSIAQLRPHLFRIESQESIDYAVGIMQKFAQQNGFHSIKIYDYPDDLPRSFAFLIDCYYFAENSNCYKNEKFLTNVYSVALLRFMALDIDLSEIPKNDYEREVFGSDFIKKYPFDEDKELNLFYWRKESHWLYYANLHRDDADLHRRFIQMADMARKGIKNS
jgi:hypothetical protein